MDDETPQRITRLTPLADVLARIDAQVEQVAPREVETVAAVGRVLAGDVSVVLHPRVPLALRDGWAVRAELTTDAGSYAPAPLPGGDADRRGRTHAGRRRRGGAARSRGDA